jgi:hypothetical protein
MVMQCLPRDGKEIVFFVKIRGIILEISMPCMLYAINISKMLCHVHVRCIPCT